MVILSGYFMKLPIILSFAGIVTSSALSQEAVSAPRGPVATTWQDVYARMQPWHGKHVAGGDPKTIGGKVFCGYQGWFSAPGDGSNAAAAHAHPGKGWVHYGDGVFEPGHCNIDIWPDMTEAGPDERYPSPFRFANGAIASIFSSYNPKTVDRHFFWMEKYGINGVFLQRFGAELRQPGTYDFCNAVMDNVRNAANAHGRTWAVMYDLSGLTGEEISSLVMEDWKRLVDRMRIRDDPAYQGDHGKPLVAVWGIGFNDGRHYDLKDCAALVDFLKNDPHYGGNSVMLGVPYGWREGVRDAAEGPELHELIEKADVVSPWSVTRYNSSQRFQEDLAIYQKPDLDWCQAHHLDYMPVIFPGFSWTNMARARNADRSGDHIDREGGAFFWKQGAGLARLRVPAVYVAMFDEMDEGTAILKFANQPPVGASRFANERNIAPDRYLWLAGQIGRALRGEVLTVPNSPDQRR